jgi:glycosyltransferase involved in cell wall biosynthesis
MAHKSKVSVITAVYNDEKYLAETIESVLAQTVTDFEYIIVDDGSTDKTPEIIKQFLHRDSRIKAVRIKNAGQANARNVALQMARGDWIAVLDGDDVWLACKLEEQINFIKGHPDIDVLGSGIIELDSRGRTICETYRPEKHQEIISLIYKECPFYHSTVMARCKFFDSLGAYNKILRRAEDRDLWFRGYKQFRYHNLQKPLIYYRRSALYSRDSLYSAYVIWRAVNRDKRLLSHSWYAARPLLAALVATVLQRKTFQTQGVKP